MATPHSPRRSPTGFRDFCMIRIDEVGMYVEPLDMRARMDTAHTLVSTVFGHAGAHHPYLFANKRVDESPGARWVRFMAVRAATGSRGLQHSGSSNFRE